MVSVQPYQDLNHALRRFRIQVSESIVYALENFPRLDSPKQVFEFLKKKVTYKKDPPDRELFQSLPTLLENNRHGIPGAGDCDCFSIAALATLLANGFTDSGIVLAGRNPLTPVHIWVYTNVGGTRYDLDLTQKVFNSTRHYQYLQRIPYKLNQTEKAMILELAEGGELSAGPRRKRGTYHVQGYFRRYPQLSEGPTQPGYVHLPNQGVYVREDYFHDSTAGMSHGEFQMHCLSEGMDFEQLAELSRGRAQRQAARSARKAAKPRNVRKLERVKGKADLRRSRGQAKLVRAQNNPQGGIRSVFSPKAQPETIDVEAQDVTYSQPTLDPATAYDWPDTESYFDPNSNLEPGTEQYYEQVQTPEQEPEYMMAEGFSINRTQVLTGLGAFAAGYFGGKLVDRYLLKR